MFVDHVEVFVVNRWDSAEWYQKTLGLTVVQELTHWAEDERGPLMISPPDGGTKLALFKGKPSVSETESGWHLVAFRVDAEGFLAFLGQLNELGLKNSAGQMVTAQDVRDHGVAFSLYFCDPDSNRLELTTYDYDKVKTHFQRFN